MSQENVESVRHFIDHAQETPDAVWDIFADDVEWGVGALSIPDFPPTFHGPTGVRDFFGRWVSMFENWGYEVEELIEAPEAVVVRIHQWGRGRGSGATVDHRFWQVWIMREAKAVRVTHWAEKADALEAAGLSE